MSSLHVKLILKELKSVLIAIPSFSPVYNLHIASDSLGMSFEKCNKFFAEVLFWHGVGSLRFIFIVMVNVESLG